jgi:hypothetical protein
MQTPLSDFDQGMADAQELGAFIEMPDTIMVVGVTIPATITDRTNAKKNIRGGQSYEVSANVNVMKADFVRTGADIQGGDQITFSDGLVGKISSVDDCAGPIFTLRIGPILAGSSGPGGGDW